jgi:adenylate cyclase
MEVEHTYTRAQQLCLQVGEPLQVAQVLFGLSAFYDVRGNHTAARALEEQFLTVADKQQDSTLSLVVHAQLGGTLLWLGEFASAQVHLDQAFACYDPEFHRDLTYHVGQDLGSMALGYAAETLWYRGYPDQALARARQGLSLAQALSHPFSLVETLGHVAVVHLCRREGQDAQAQAEALVTLAHEHGFAWWLGVGTSLQGWALGERAARSGTREQGEAGLVQIREGLAILRDMGAEQRVPPLLGAVAQGYAHGGQAQDGLRVVAEALAVVEKTKERWNEAELYRLKGELTLQQEGKEQGAGSREQKSENPHPYSQILDPQGEAEACFLKAIEVSQKQQARSLELRAVMSLVHLRQRQVQDHATRTTQHVPRVKLAEAHTMLSELYNWFTEGFDTKDLQEAKALLDALA